MKLLAPTEEENLRCLGEFGYSLSKASKNGIWFIGVKPVMFGYRAVAWRRNSVGPTVDYCAASDSEFLCLLMNTLASIFRCLPESITERQVTNMMPGWKIRPINKDKTCWRELQSLAINLARKGEVD